MQSLDIERDEDVPLHVCDLSQFVTALTTLLYSPEHAAHCERWGEPVPSGRMVFEPKLTSEINAPPDAAQRQAEVYRDILRIPPERRGEAVMEQEEPWPLWRRLLNRTRARRKP